MGNEAGQHLDVRLTAPDGYQAARSYSVATAGGGQMLEISVDEIDDGEVSPYLVHGLSAGDKVEVRGPLGRWFSKPFNSSSKAVSKSGSAGRKGRGKMPL